MMSLGKWMITYIPAMIVTVVISWAIAALTNNIFVGYIVAFAGGVVFMGVVSRS